MNREIVEAREVEFQRRWHRAHAERLMELSNGQVDSWRERDIAPHAAEGLQLLEALRRNGDLGAFQQATDRWSRSFPSGYKGVSGQMILNQINKLSSDPAASVAVLVDALTVPTDLGDAVRKVRLLADHLQEIRVGAHPSPKRAPFVATYFWGLEDAQTWPVAWPNSFGYLEYCTGTEASEDQGQRYAELYEFATEIDGDPLRFEQVAAWWSDDRPVVIDEVLCDRAQLREGADKETDDPSWFTTNARALLTVAQHIGGALLDQVSDAAGRELKVYVPPLIWNKPWPRGDFWTDWRVPNTAGLGVRLWLNPHGLAIGLRPYPDNEPGYVQRAIEFFEQSPLPGYQLLAGRGAKVGTDVGFIGGAVGEVLYGRWFSRSEFPNLDVAGEVARMAQELAPLITSLHGDAQPEDGDPLAPLVVEFKEAIGYPTERHQQDKSFRRESARLLEPEQLAVTDRSGLRKIWNSSRYGSTGPMSVLNTALRDAGDDEYDQILATFDYLCWGAESPAVRIDRVLEDEELRVKGLGESVAMKMLAITHPERFVSIYPYKGPKGKLRMLQLLGLDAPSSGSRGELQVASNDALRERLEPYFPGDMLGIGEFLYWYSERDDEPEVEPVEDPLGQLADKLLVDREFVEDVVALLEEKKQVVFYGPPGTGKTYFARKLAEVLVADPDRRPIVQFHPSTSYEDFFEGYRPETDVHGAMSYRLQKGPLGELAARASEAPGRRHVMIIDEINRANLPKVLGELLFLLEYRNTPIRTLYRPDDPFELSKDIWFIGTMNTADRSIALVDAALRRRFHFVPFFPNHGPMKGLLGRWLENESEPAWIGELVEQVNDELEQALGGPHLQLGPSHFMKKDLDEAKLRRIWEYDIEPFIEDQFFGDPARILEFRFDAVLSRFKDLAPESITESESTAGDQG